jgi:hypothetical protein
MPVARSKPPVPPNTSLLLVTKCYTDLIVPRFDQTFGSESVDVHTPTCRFAAGGGWIAGPAKIGRGLTLTRFRSAPTAIR